LELGQSLIEIGHCGLHHAGLLLLLCLLLFWLGLGLALVGPSVSGTHR
jgi:hypothetical protein